MVHTSRRELACHVRDGSCGIDAMRNPPEQQEVDHRHPDLCHHGVFRRAEERLDLQVLLDPPEEGLDVPSAFVDLCDIPCRQTKFICQVLVDIPILINEGDLPQIIRISFLRCRKCECHPFILQHAFPFGDTMQPESEGLRVLLPSNDEVMARFSHALQQGVIVVPAIHHEDGALCVGGEIHVLRHCHFMRFPVRQIKKIGNLTPNVQIHVQPQRTFARTELRPVEQLQTDGDGRGVDGVQRVFERETLFVAQRLALGEQDVKQRFEDGGGPLLIGVGQSGAGDTPQPQFTPRAVQDTQIRLDFPQAFPAGDLGVEEGCELIEAGEALHVPVGFMLSNKRLKLLFREKIEQLVEDCGRVGVHQKGGK